MADDSSVVEEEAMPQTVETYRHYDDERSFARDREKLRARGWRVEGVQVQPRRHGHRSVDVHYLRPSWPDSSQ
jgi:hypothetical protein